MAETKPVGLRLNKEMLEDIEMIVEEFETFSNKTDFIISAMREYYQLIVEKMIDIDYEGTDWSDASDPLKAKTDESKIKWDGRSKIITDSVKYYKDGPMGDPIIVRVPIGFYREIVNLGLILKHQFGTIQEYCRQAIAESLIRYMGRYDAVTTIDLKWRMEGIISMRDTLKVLKPLKHGLFKGNHY